jgi:hypothetical protein
MHCLLLLGVPRVLHYGLLFEVQHKAGKWSWDKHWYHGFDVHKCPPWDLSAEHPLEGLFPMPPGPNDLLPNVRSAVAWLLVGRRWECVLDALSWRVARDAEMLRYRAA